MRAVPQGRHVRLGLDCLISPDPIAFSRQWVDVWNAHDVEAVLEHFHDDVVFTSPVAARLLPETDGTLVNVDGLAQSVVAGAKAPGDARQGWKVLRALGGVLKVAGFEFDDLAGLRDGLDRRSVHRVSARYGWSWLREAARSI